MVKKRTKDQVLFDSAKHGWAFASGSGLRERVEKCEKIATRLAADDERHETLRQMRRAMERGER